MSIQGSNEWLAERRGHLTASRMADATAFLKSGKEAAARYGYKLEIIAERLTGQCVERFVTKEMIVKAQSDHVISCFR